MRNGFFSDDEVVGRFYDARLIKRLLGYVGRYAALAVLALVLVLTGMGLFLVNPWLLGRIVDLGIRGRDADMLVKLGCLYGAVELLIFVVTYAHNYLLQVIGQRVMYDLRAEFFSHLQRMPLPFFDRNPVGRLVTRVTNDIATLAELFSSGIVMVIGDLVLIIGIAATLIGLQPTLGLATLSTVPLLAVAAWFFQTRIRMAFREVRTRIARVNAALSENLSGIRVIQIFTQEARRARRFDELNASHRDAQLDSVFYHSLFTPTVTIINAVCIVVVLLLGGHMHQTGALSLGLLVSFLTYAQNFFHPIRNISEKVTIFQSAMASAERVFALLDEPEESGCREGAALGEVRGEIVFDRVSFSYTGTHEVLHEISFTVAPGQSVAIVGHTGAGKTTITALLNRMYEVTRGRILLDGRDLRDIAKFDLRRRIAVIHQDVFLFADTVLENIRLWDPAVPPERVEQIAREIGADPFIRALPHGYRTELQERGANLSTGQRQLISFARALCADPAILVLDEATSSIDSESEKIIQEAIKTLTRGRTCLIIAHRLSTIRHCDRILVLHQGHLVESGTHDELLARRSFYHKLYELQFL
ncbi:MAG: Lipid A export ATP-binding/permease protein MsbA [Candidatus Ozemobacter sibiricus]|uniref:Lipid A export ATP-binding/permease protein MsbA n=1 Tax=Candidatus Ozemobacter sibiricus TaxID=2268124 RepID=A0A367ZD22_9BACT|nr:MAG: Lipid A export ATP-binding/permease protein MsbA [Candidatus Ozemobacter sibiricus]